MPKIGFGPVKDYSSIKVEARFLLNNQEPAVRWNVIDDTWNLIGETDRPRAWGMTPPTSNAYYRSS